MKKCYMHNPESVLDNVTHKLLRDFEIQISVKRPGLIIINNNNNKKKRELAELWTLLSQWTTESN